MRLSYLILQLINCMMIVVHASASAEDVSAFFKFLPDSQYNQLKPRIHQILYSRPLSNRPISEQAMTITSKIMDAFKSVTRGDVVSRSGHLARRSESDASESISNLDDQHSHRRNGQLVASGHSSAGAQSEHSSAGAQSGDSSAGPQSEDFAEFLSKNKDLNMLGFVDIDKLTADELKQYIQFLNMNKLDMGSKIEAAISILRAVHEHSVARFTSEDNPLHKKFITKHNEFKVKLDGLSNLSIEDQIEELKSMSKDVKILIHPDRHKILGEAEETIAKELFQKYEGRINNIPKVFGEDEDQTMLFSGKEYQNIIDNIKDYEKGTKWVFTPSETKAWKKLMSKASAFANGASEQDIADLRTVLKYKENGQKVPKSLKMKYYYRKYMDYLNILQQEMNAIDNLIHKKVTRLGDKLYLNPKWIELQRFLEDRYEAISCLENDLPHKHLSNAAMHNYMKTAVYGLIGTLLSVVVLSWIKQKMFTSSKPTAHIRNQHSEPDLQDMSDMDWDDLNDRDYGKYRHISDMDWDDLKDSDYGEYREK